MNNAFSFFIGIVVPAYSAVLAVARKAEVIVRLAIVELLGALAVFRRFQTSAFRSIQLAVTLPQIAERGREVIGGVYPGAR